MTKNLKKIIGTSVLSIVVLSIVFMTASLTQAKFFNPWRNITVDGIVDTIALDSITINTNGSDPITFDITDDTNFLGDTSPGNIDPGDVVRVRGRKTDGSYRARSIRLEDDADQYGTAGDNVYVREGTVTDKGDVWFTINNGVVDITFQLTPETKFTGINFPFLNIGDKVRVRGEDTGTSFIAEHVYLKD